MITFETDSEFEKAVMEVLKKRLSISVESHQTDYIRAELYDNENGDSISCAGDWVMKEC